MRRRSSFIITGQGLSSITKRYPPVTEQDPASAPCGSTLGEEIDENDFREDLVGLVDIVEVVDNVDNVDNVDDWLARKRGSSVNDGDNYQQKEANPDDGLEVVSTRLRGNRRYDSLPH